MEKLDRKSTRLNSRVYAEYIMRNAKLDEAQAGIKIARRNINNLIYANDTTLMAESKKELKSLLMKVKEPCIQISQEAGQVVWYSYLFKNFPQFVVIHTVKGFGESMKPK